MAGSGQTDDDEHRPNRLSEPDVAEHMGRPSRFAFVRPVSTHGGEASSCGGDKAAATLQIQPAKKGVTLPLAVLFCCVG